MNIKRLYSLHNFLIHKYNTGFKYKIVKKQIGASINIDNYITYNKCIDYPYVLNNVNRIIAIGDIHGDLDLVLASLVISNVIKIHNDFVENSIEINHNNTNKYITWIGNNTYVVQIGDQIDRCRPFAGQCKNINETYKDENSDIKIIFFFSDLHELAQKYGGKVISLLGNHELMNVNGNMSYVSRKGITEFSSNHDYYDGLENRKKLFSIKEKKIAKFLACTRLAAIKINNILFVHAGILPHLAKKYKIDDINNIIREWLYDNINNSNTAHNNLPFTFEDVQTISGIIFWTRTLGSLKPNLPISNKLCQKHVVDTLNIYDVNTIVIGHTPQIINGGSESNINITCDSVWRIDGAYSKAFKNFNQISGIMAKVLEITFKNNKPIFNLLEGEVNIIWQN